MTHITYISARKPTTNQRIAKNLDTRELFLPHGMKKLNLYDIVDFLCDYKKLKISRSALKQYKKLISCTKNVDWKAGNLCISYFGVNKMSKELTISRRQVLNNNQQLANHGLIAFVDYGNYRRFGKRDENGCLIEDRAFGLDLKPVLELLEGFQQIKADIVWENEQHTRLRNRVSHLRRRIFSAIPEEMKAKFADILAIRPRYEWAIEEFSMLKDQLEQLWDHIVEWYQQHEKIGAETDEKQPSNSKNTKNYSEPAENVESAEENFPQVGSKFPTLIDNHNTNPHFVKEPSGISPLAQSATWGVSPHASFVSPHLQQDRKQSAKNQAMNDGMPLTLGQVLNVHMEELEMRQAQDRDISTEQSVVLNYMWQKASSLAAQLGIHKTAIADAVTVFGYRNTALLIHYIHDRVSGNKPIKSAGGYTRYCIENPKHALQKIEKCKKND